VALLASGIYLEDKNMGGIDQQITDRITRANGNPQKLMGQYGDTKSILDLIAAQRAADLVKEQRQQVALQMKGNPATVADELEKELVDGQKAEMRGPLEGLKNLRGDQAQGDKTRGVAGVLANQQRMAQQQRPTMNVAHGGIINAPAPNLNRMYNGGIVGYAEGGLTGDEIAAYLKEVGIKQEEYDNATPRVRARVIEGINKLIAEDRDLGTARGTGSLNIFGGTTKSDAQMEDRNRQIREFFTAPFRGPATGEELKQGRKEFNPTEQQDAAERLMNLPDVRGGMELDIGTREQPTPLEDDIYGRLPTMMPKGAMGVTPGGDYSPTGKYGNTEGVDAQTGLTFAETQEALGNNARLNTFSDELAGIGETKAEAAALAAAEAARLEAEKTEAEGNKPPSLMKQLKQRAEKDFDPYADAPTTPVNTGIAGITSSGTGATTTPPPANTGIAGVLPGGKKKPLTRAEELQKEIDALDEKKGVFDKLLSRAANTKFKKSYGSNSEALASGLRDIAETGQIEKATKRKSLEGQLATEQAITAAQVLAEAKESEFAREFGLRQKAEGRLRETMTNQQRNDFARLALDTHKERGNSLVKLAELGLETEKTKAAQEYRMASLALQEQANGFAEDRNINAMHNVVRGYVTAATSFYKGLLANAVGAEAKAIQYELKAEIARIVGMVGTDGKINLSELRKLGAAPAVTEATASNVDAAVAAGI